jgi:hypothetical protein
VLWDVWDVRPGGIERRHRDTRPPVERRVRSEFRVSLGMQMVDGWLTFESLEHKRRLAPIPENWSQVPDTELLRLCEQAVPVRERIW